MLRRLIDALSTGSTAWGLLPTSWQVGVIGGASAVTAYFGFYEVGIARAIFLTLGVTAFGFGAIFFLLRIGELTGLFQRLSVSVVSASDASIAKDLKSITHINLQVTLKNDSHRLMFYRLKRAHVFVARQTPDSTTVDRNVIIIAPGGTANVSLSTINSIPLPDGPGPAPKGALELEIEYGSASDRLTYLFHYESTLQLGGAVNEEKKEVTLNISSQIKTLEHSRNK